MLHRRLALVLVLAPTLLACDAGEPKPDPAAEAKAKEEAEAEARMAKRREERKAKEAEEQRVQEEIAAKIQKITAIPEGTKLPKKITDACKQVVEAQRAFLTKFYPDLEEAAIATQVGMLEKQCVEMNDIDVAICQKFALEATDEQLKSMINEYLPACLGKYGEAAAPPAGP